MDFLLSLITVQFQRRWLKRFVMGAPMSLRLSHLSGLRRTSLLTLMNSSGAPIRVTVTLAIRT
jgi:hypothetical protein